MKIALIGATGNVGTRLISELRRRGHQVTAIARHPEKLDRQDGVNPAVGDVQNENALAAVLAGHDVAIHSVKFLKYRSCEGNRRNQGGESATVACRRRSGKFGGRARTYPCELPGLSPRIQT